MFISLCSSLPRCASISHLRHSVSSHCLSSRPPLLSTLSRSAPRRLWRWLLLWLSGAAPWLTGLASGDEILSKELAFAYLARCYQAATFSAAQASQTPNPSSCLSSACRSTKHAPILDGLAAHRVLHRLQVLPNFATSISLSSHSPLTQYSLKTDTCSVAYGSISTISQS